MTNSIPGYDDWKTQGPPENTCETCDRLIGLDEELCSRCLSQIDRENNWEDYNDRRAPNG